MRITTTDILLGAVMFAAVAAVHLTCQDPGSEDMLFVPLSGPPLLFAFSLSQAFLKGIASARDPRGGTVAQPPWTAFGNAMRPRSHAWLALWTTYFVAVEVSIKAVFDDFNGIVSAASTAVILGMLAACFAWAPRCRKPWTLALLAVITTIPAFVLFLVLGAMVLVGLGLEGPYGFWILVYSPWIASGCLLAVAVVSLSLARRRGDAWFSPSNSSTGTI